LKTARQYSPDVNKSEFEDLYTQMSVLVFGIAARRLSPDQAKDVVADTFTVVWKRRQSCPDDPTEWPAWTVGIAKNKIRKELDRVHRKHHDNRFVSEIPARSMRATIPDVADRVAEAALGRWIWNQLRAEDKQLANYAFVQGVSHTHAAGALGISVTNYTTRVTRLRQRIALLLSLGEPALPELETGKGSP
jgi:RNA polymerase sigma factor (sigma-70 family)